MWGTLILKASTKLVKKMEMNVVLVKKICPLVVDHVLQSFFTTSLLLLSLIFEDSTLELEFTKNHNLPQFKLPMAYEVLKILNLDTFEDGNTKVCYSVIIEFFGFHF